MNAGDTDRLAELQARAQAMGVTLVPAGRGWSAIIQASGFRRDDLADLREAERALDLLDQQLARPRSGHPT